jgi:putative membrane protein
MFWYGSPGTWGWVLGLGSILFWVMLALAIAALLGLFTRGRRRPDGPYPGYADEPGPYGQPGAGPGHRVPPEQILAERFARGEINQEEFHERMAVLRAEARYPGDVPGPF